MSTIKVNTITKRTGSTLTLGEAGTTVAIASGATTSGMGRTGTVDWQTTVKTSGFTAVSGEGYFCNTTGGAFTVTLPASPSAGSIVAIKDYANTFDTNTLTIGRNSQPIGGVASNSFLTSEGISVTLVYIDSTKGWLITNSGLQSEAPGPEYVEATGGTILTVGDFKTHVFTSPGSFAVSAVGNPSGSNSVEYLVVAGGGSGGRYIAGGGGSGGVRTYTSLSPATPINAPASLPVSAQSYPVTVGAGAGAVGPAGCSGPSTEVNGASGSVTTFSSITSAGGGGGGRCAQNGLSGGSGGGSGGRSAKTGGAGNTPPVSPPQGKDGGDCPNSPTSSGGGGGGGATTEGSIRCGSQIKHGGAGGTGAFINATFFGPTAPSYGQAPSPLAPNGRYFGGGGGSGGFDTSNTALANGGAGGGGQGTSAAPGGASPNNLAATAGTANTGGGGGVAGVSSGFGNQPGAGGSGVVAIRYKFQN